ncbi:arrestin domain-containing protein 2-like isoform X2 [Prorops nasuta]|uniref:arrestin domain-containing protein 2-like isoform X2 n=1 Tax=Prorops nasuta TaxID=863751 RepID=UPI0034CE3C64
MDPTLFQIELDRPSACYAPGEIIEGRLLLEYVGVGTQQIQGLKLYSKGAANILWVKSPEPSDALHQGFRNENFTANEEYFTIYHYILISPNDHTSIEIPCRRTAYPFRMQLPEDIPSSLEGEHGSIKYHIKGLIERKNAPEYECQLFFTVIRPVDLNNYPHECLPIHDESQEKYCCYCFHRGQIKMIISTDSAGFVPGQTMRISIKYTLSTRNVHITEFGAKLEQILTYRATNPTEEEINEKNIIQREKIRGIYRNDGTMDLHLLIPNLPSSIQEHCRHISVDYNLNVKILLAGHTNVYKSYPILIGTIALGQTAESMGSYQPPPRYMPPQRLDPNAPIQLSSLLQRVEGEGSEAQASSSSSSGPQPLQGADNPHYNPGPYLDPPANTGPPRKGARYYK